MIQLTENQKALLKTKADIAYTSLRIEKDKSLTRKTKDALRLKIRRLKKCI